MGGVGSAVELQKRLRNTPQGEFEILTSKYSSPCLTFDVIFSKRILFAS